MKWWNEFGLALTAVVFLAGCASHVYVEKDESANLAKYRTFTWVQTRASQDNDVSVTGFADDAVHNAVRAELERQGWREVMDGGADVLVSYDVLVERGTATQSDPVYTQPFRRVYYNPYRRTWASVYYPSQFIGYDTYDVPVKEGTLSISLMDARTDKTVWQGWTTETLDNSKISSDDLSRSVRTILKKFEKDAQ